MQPRNWWFERFCFGWTEFHAVIITINMADTGFRPCVLLFPWHRDKGSTRHLEQNTVINYMSNLIVSSFNLPSWNCIKMINVQPWLARRTLSIPRCPDDFDIFEGSHPHRFALILIMVNTPYECPSIMTPSNHNKRDRVRIPNPQWITLRFCGCQVERNACGWLSLHVSSMRLEMMVLICSHYFTQKEAPQAERITIRIMSSQINIL